jgi:hypothetical protein
VARKGSRRGEFRERMELAGVEREREKRDCSTVWSQEEVDEDARSSATSPRPQAGEQLRGWVRGGVLSSSVCRGGSAARDPHRLL